MIGNPPGKNNDPLGDQVSWEQILRKAAGKPSLWVITKDSDYATKYEGRVFLNGFLYDELASLYKKEPDVFCFDNLAEGLKHFVKTTSVKTEKLLTPRETEQIKEEQDSLPPLDWQVDSNVAANSLASTFAYDTTHFAEALAGVNLVYDPARRADAILAAR